MNMHTKKLALCAVVLTALAGCGGDDTTTPPPAGDAGHDASPGVDANMPPVDANMPPVDANMPVDAGKDGGGFPTAPTLGAQIDRLGRPAVNTALTDPFWDDGVQTVDQHHAKQDAYNAASDPTMWAGTMVGGKTVLALFKGNLAAFDGLDTGLPTAPNTCGNQLAFGGPLGAAYTTLATVLADDEIYLDTTTATCNQYLGVEAKALGVAITDCGGRTLTYNVADTTYNALVIGAFTGPVVNGVTADGDGSPSNTTFPFLGAPN
jgi:hypothetical protein